MLILAYTLGIYSQSKSILVNWLHFLTVLATRQINVPLIGFCPQYNVVFNFHTPLPRPIFLNQRRKSIWTGVGSWKLNRLHGYAEYIVITFPWSNACLNTRIERFSLKSLAMGFCISPPFCTSDILFEEHAQLVFV